jgi:hypothetical protein
MHWQVFSSISALKANAVLRALVILIVLCCWLPDRISAQVLSQDSLALVALYQSTDGAHWTDNTNWLKPGKNVSTWVGINVTNHRVTDIELGANNLNGFIPKEIGNLFELGFLGLESNHLSGTIPASLNKIDKLLYVILSDNEYTGQIPAFLVEVPIPANGGYLRQIVLDNNNFTGVESWSNFRKVFSLSIENNRLDFQDIEPYLKESIPVFTYAPQKPIYTADEIILREGGELTLKTLAEGSGNHYQWLKNNNSISGATQATLTLRVTQAIEGKYTARVTNPIASDLTLERSPVVLHVKPDTVYVSCNGSPITLNASVTDPQATYRWSTGATTPSLTVNASGKYGMLVETTNYILKDTLEVVFFPKLSLGPDVDTCDPSVIVSSNISNADSYTWQIPGGNISHERTITAQANGRYILEVVTPKCVQKDTLQVIVNRFTEGNFEIATNGKAFPDNGVALTAGPLKFTNTTAEGNDFIWSFADGSTSTENDPIHTFNSPGLYIVTLKGTDSRECPITVEKTINVKNIFITNAISPNGDGKNDRLYIEPFLYPAELRVINRWGQEVYKTIDYNDDFTGSNLEGGVYYYELYFREIDKSFNGYVHVLK